MHPPSPPAKSDVTLVTVTTEDRAIRINAVAKAWGGPGVFVIWTARLHTDITVLEGSRLILTPPLPGESLENGDFPVNRLRNQGIAAVNTSHYIVLDVDMVPSLNARSILLQLLAGQGSMIRPTDALVLPIFENLYKGDRAPRNQRELSTCMKSKRCQRFQLKYAFSGHFDTNYPRWWGATKPYVIECIQKKMYEPYVVLSNISLVRYDERFTGYGW